MKLTKPQARNVNVDGATVKVWDAILAGSDSPEVTLATRAACAKWCRARNEELRAAARQAKAANAGMVGILKRAKRLLETDAAVNGGDCEQWFQANISDDASRAYEVYSRPSVAAKRRESEMARVSPIGGNTKGSNHERH